MAMYYGPTPLGQQQIETPPSDEGFLSPSDLREVYKEAYEARAVWRQLGLELKLTPGDLDAINAETSEMTTGEKLQKVLQYWLNTGTATWKQLIESLKQKHIGQSETAKNIAKNHSTQEVQPVDHNLRRESGRTATMEANFSELVKFTREALQKKGKMNEVVSYVRNIKVFIGSHGQNSFLLIHEHDQLVRAENSNNFDLLFAVLDKYWSFLDCSLLEVIIRKFLSNIVKRNSKLEKYKSELKPFSEAKFGSCEIDLGRRCKTSIFGSSHRVALCFVIQLKTREAQTLNVYTSIRNLIVSAFDVAVTSVTLDKLKIQSDFVELVLLVPRIVVQLKHVTEELKAKLNRMTSASVLKIIVLDEAEQQRERTFYDASTSPSAIRVQRVWNREKPPAETYFDRRQLKLDGKCPASAIQLVKYDAINSRFVLNEDAIRLLKSIDSRKSVAVLSICGPLRTGKSYFMSKILKSDVFKASNGMDPCTKGIWMSTMILETADMAVILLDTEGMDAPQDGEFKDVIKYIVITTLLSSFLIYNTLGAPTTFSIEKLSCFGEFSQKLLIQEGQNLKAHDLKEHYPDFLWLIRDMGLKPRDASGNEMSMTEYANTRYFAVGQGSNSRKDTNVRIIKEVFPTIECKTISPSGCDMLNTPQSFNLEVNDAIQHVFERIKPKYGFNKLQPLTGSMLAALLVQYVNAVNDHGDSVLLEESYLNAVKLEMNEIIKQISADYSDSLKKILQLPLEEGDVDVLMSSHVSLKEDCMMKWSDFVKDSVAKPQTFVNQHPSLLEYHVITFTEKLEILCKEINRFVPPSKATLGENSVQIEMIQTFQEIIVKIHDNEVVGGKLQIYVDQNRAASQHSCEKCFEELYRQQTSNSSEVDLQKLEASYKKKAIGPAKNTVFQDLSATIPGPPVNIKQVDATGKTITISWNKLEAAVSSYEVICRLPQKGVVYFKSFHNDELKCEITGLQPNTEYNVRVRGKNESRVGVYCHAILCKTKICVPKCPDLPQISAKSPENGTLTVKALPIENRNGGRITQVIVSKRGEKSADWTDIVHNVDPHEKDSYILNVDVTCSSEDSSIFFRVKMKNEAGESEPSMKCELSADNMKPGPPHNVVPIASERAITLTWEPPQSNQKSAKFYSIQYKELKRDEWKRVAYQPVKCACTINGLVPNTWYTVNIESGNRHEMGESVTIPAETLIAVPNRPQNLTLKVISATQAKISFDSPTQQDANGSPITDVIIERRTRDETPQDLSMMWEKEEKELKNESDVGSTQFDIDLVSIDRKMSVAYRLRFKNVKGKSECSKVIHLQLDEMIPGAVQELDAPGNKKTCESIVLTWKPPAISPFIAKSYEILFKESNTTSWQTATKELTNLKIIEDGIISFCINQLKVYTQYDFCVKVKNFNQTIPSESMEVLNVQTLPSVPPQPKKPEVRITENKFSLSVVLSSIGECGEEINLIYINHYNREQMHLISRRHKVIANEIPQNRHVIIRDLQINTDDTAWVSVTLRNKIGVSEKESDLVGICADNVAPGEPANFHHHTIEARRVILRWNVPIMNGNAAKSYDIYCTKICNQALNLELKKSYERQLENRESGLEYEAEVGDLKPFTDYLFRIYARNNACKGDYAEIPRVTTMKCAPNSPSKPIAIDVDEKNPSKASIHLFRLSKEQMNGSDIDEIIIINECCIGSMPSYWIKLKHTVSPMGDAAVYEGVQAFGDITLPSLDEIEEHFTHYSFRIIMKNNEGLSKPSDPYLLQIKSLPPGAPEKLTVEDGACTAHSLTVSWEEPNFNKALTDSYLIEYGISGMGVYKQIAIHSSIKRQKISELKSNTQYKVRVCALHGTIRGKFLEVEKSTAQAFPTAPVNLHAEKASENSIKIRWSNPQRFSREVLYYRVEVQDGDELLHTRKIKGHSAVFSDLEPSKAYNFRVTSVNLNDRENPDGATVDKQFSTKMGKHKRRFLEAAAGMPTFGAGAVAVRYAVGPDRDIIPSDEEYNSDEN